MCILMMLLILLIRKEFHSDIIDKEGISLRSGHHCAQVLMERLNVAATSRASFYIYNTKKDVDALIDSLNIVAKVFKL